MVIEVVETTQAARQHASVQPQSAPPFGVQFPILFIVFLFFASGDLFAFNDIRIGEGKYEAYRDTFRAVFAGFTGIADDPEVQRSPAGPIIFGLLYLPALFLSLRRRDWLGLIFGMAALHALGLAFLEKYAGIGTDGLVNLAFGFALPVSFGWLVLNARIWSPAYGFLLLVTYPFVLAISPANGSVFWSQVLPYLSLHLSLVLLLLLLRTVWLIFIENLYIVRQLGLREFGAVAGRTLWKWTPILLFAVPYLTLSYAIDRQTRTTAYEQRLMRAQLFDQPVVISVELTPEQEAVAQKRSALTKAQIAEKKARDLLTMVETVSFWSPMFTTEQQKIVAGAQKVTTAARQDLQAAQAAEARWVADKINRCEAVRVFSDRPADDKALEWRDISGRDLEADTLEALRAHFQEKKIEWCEQLQKISNKLNKSNAGEFSHFVGESYDRVFTPGLGMEPPDHDGFWQFVTEPATAAAQESMEKAYNRKHRQTRKNLVREADKYEPKIATVQNGAADALETLESESIGALNAARDATLVSVQSGFFVSRAFNWLTFVLFWVLCVRSLFYVFSRVACARETSSMVTLGDPDGTAGTAGMPAGRIEGRGAKLNLPIQPDAAFYVARRFQPHGKAPKFAVPQSGAAPLPRLRYGCYTMNAFTQSEGGAPVQITATRGAEFVEWQLAEGESAVFSYRNFVGMSAGVRLSALISARVTSQIFGSFIFPIATGPGTLILMTEGVPHVGATEGEAFSMPPSRLVAWQQSARFHVESELGMLDVYLSEAYVEPEARSVLVMDVDRQDGFGTGLARFIRRFLLPI